ncbi:MAG TPA: substrate-binding domain-containing protein [Anaerolineales bacterium]|nr:substrate-binding domain-containing protein [Anaerolineales bacterium]
MKQLFSTLWLIAIFLTSCNTASKQNKDLLLVSTTSTQDSGLLDVLLPAFTEKTGYKVQLVAVGSGQALKLGEQGNADVILLHSPAAEKDFVAKGFGIDRRLVMHNDFVIVGPASDPAGIRDENPVQAFEKIFAAHVIFVSRGDDSGTHVKELALWKNAGLDPKGTGEDWYLETGQGQGATLSVASEKGGYALTDRGTFLAYKSNVDLEILVEGDPFLLNVYHVITVNPEKWPKVNFQAAKAFADFITSPEGQDVIAKFGVEKYGQPLFFPDANKTDAELGVP